MKWMEGEKPRKSRLSKFPKKAKKKKEKLLVQLIPPLFSIGKDQRKRKTEEQKNKRTKGGTKRAHKKKEQIEKRTINIKDKEEYLIYRKTCFGNKFFK